MDLSGVEIFDGVVETVVVNVTDVVPFSLLQLALKPLDESLLRSGRVHKERVGNLCHIGTVGEKVRGKKERQSRVDDADSADSWIARSARGRRDT